MKGSAIVRRGYDNYDLADGKSVKRCAAGRLRCTGIQLGFKRTQLCNGVTRKDLLRAIIDLWTRLIQIKIPLQICDQHASRRLPIRKSNVRAKDHLIVRDQISEDCQGGIEVCPEARVQHWFQADNDHSPILGSCDLGNRRRVLVSCNCPFSVRFLLFSTVLSSSFADLIKCRSRSGCRSSWRADC